MDLTLQPEFYQPSIDDLGNFVDYNPTSQEYKRGIKCPCGTRSKVVIFYKKSLFNSHKNSITHQKWLADENNNKKNYYRKVTELTQLYENQKIIIANYEREIIEKNALIAELSQQINKKKLSSLTNITPDLLSFD